MKIYLIATELDVCNKPNFGTRTERTKFFSNQTQPETDNFESETDQTWQLKLEPDQPEIEKILWENIFK